MRTMRTVAITIAMLAAAAALAAADARKVAAIEFRGLVNLSKYDIMRGVRYRTEGSGIIIDMDSLEDALKVNYYLESYRVDRAGGRLVVTVAEKRPAMVVVMEGARRSVVYELDGSFAILARNEVHTGRVPILCLTAGETAGVVRRLFAVLGRVRKSFPSLYRELSEIYLRGGGLRVVLRGRRTVFSLGADVADFARLNYLAGYCDRSGRYPEEIQIAGNEVIVR
jgi:hypothetical protein